MKGPRFTFAGLLIKPVKFHVDHPFWMGPWTLLLLVILGFTQAWLVFIGYIIGYWGVHYITSYQNYHDLYYGSSSPEASVGGKFDRLGSQYGWGIIVAAVCLIASAIMTGIYYDEGLGGHGWTLLIPLGVMALYEWIIIEPYESRPTLLERFKEAVYKADEQWNGGGQD